MCKENSFIGQFAASPLLMNSADGSCKCKVKRFIGSARSGASFDRVPLNFTGSAPEEVQSAAPSQSAPSEKTGGSVAAGWLTDALQITKKIVGVEDQPVDSSSSGVIISDQDTSSSKAVWFIIGAVILLIVIFVIIKMNKK